MAFSFGYSPWLLTLSLILAAGITYWTYRATIPALSSGRRLLLGSLRFTSLALLCFLLLQPVVHFVSETEEPPILAVLVDNSRSMRVVQGDTTNRSAQTVRDRLHSILRPLKNNLPGTTRYFEFDAAVRHLSEPPFDSLTVTGTRTDISTALQSVRNELRGEHLGGVALVSDGQYNTGQNPSRTADRFPVPIHTITVGDTAERRDLQVRRLATNDIAYVDTDVPVEVTLGAQDVGGETTRVSLQTDGSEVDAADIELRPGTVEHSVVLSFQPESAGFKRLSVQASPVPGEATTQNNVRTTTLRVLESKREVLLLGAAPSPNYAALHRILSRDANTNVTARVPQVDGSFYGGPLPDTLSAFDAIVCAGFPSSSVPTEAVRRVATAINDGAPALFVLDHQTDISAWRQHFDDALPLLPEENPNEFAMASFAPRDQEHSHPVFQIDGADVSLFRRLPPVSVPTTAWTPTPDATVLGEATRVTLSRRDPVLVVRRRAGHRTAAFLGTGTWRWATLPADLERADSLWPGLVTNLLRWVATKQDDRQVRVRPTATTFQGDEPVEFRGQVYDESMSPVADAQVSVTVTDSAGATYPHTMEPVGNGRYALNVGSLPEGTYRYEASATLDNSPLGHDQGQLSVGDLRLEYQETRANPILMRQIAARSGGRAYAPNEVGSLPAELADSPAFSSRLVTNRTESKLWHRWLFLLIVLGLLAVEWTLRKRFGLT